MRPDSKKLLAIGGLDPSGHAGILADARVFHHFGLPFLVALTAVTAQSERKFLSWEAVSPSLFRRQLALAPGGIRGIKLGMLGTLVHARILSGYLRRRRPRVVLWDPVLVSSTGFPLLKTPRPNETLWRLLKQVDIFTPNVGEAGWFLGRSIQNISELEEAGRDLQGKMKPGATLILKGGHLKASGGFAVDLLIQGKNSIPLTARRRPGDPRGTGCAFGSACLAYLLQGRNRLEAAKGAKRYVLNHVFHAPTP